MYYIPIIVGAFLYNYRYAIVFPVLSISGQLLTLYLPDKSDVLLTLFEISIPIYFVVFALIAKLKVKAEAVQEYYSKFSQSMQDTINALLSALEAKDLYTYNHSNRVSRLAKLIAQKMDLASKEIEKIYLAARLHDIGKIGINTTILNKPQKLSAEEFAL
ncbi:HD domain-containing protein [Caldanaerobius fijiensis DSM 17918]|uniref:HD domain-containing protein n=1 Tax=Caldanaerobius fijiensis DSM 17918 TaxID=1121256 RepID=A0A1M4V3B3_9THEO|nr:HD domain-containing protein [Caldanaerobius fijiensis]SHE63484.1 HD domain-containing protein [Caldanaerobius fijiensis DSM 17918]